MGYSQVLVDVESKKPKISSQLKCNHYKDYL